MAKGGRLIIKRLEVKDSEVQTTMNTLLADRWIVEPPEPLEIRPTRHLRERVPSADLMDRVNKLVEDGWEDVKWEDDEEEWKPALLYATKYEEPRYRIVAIKSLSKQDIIDMLEAHADALSDRVVELEDQLRVAEANEDESEEASNDAA